MTVSELIDFLKTQPQDLQVCYGLFSEQCLLRTEQIELLTACDARPDGWVEDARPDKPTRTYLCFPGN